MSVEEEGVSLNAFLKMSCALEKESYSLKEVPGDLWVHFLNHMDFTCSQLVFYRELSWKIVKPIVLGGKLRNFL